MMIFLCCFVCIWSFQSSLWSGDLIFHYMWRPCFTWKITFLYALVRNSNCWLLLLAKKISEIFCIALCFKIMVERTNILSTRCYWQNYLCLHCFLLFILSDIPFIYIKQINKNVIQVVPWYILFYNLYLNMPTFHYKLLILH